ncbi:MAG: protease modulator HflC [Planctomycetes bacterium]|nr:protease modulator HflC [Planctomycetota bacterium]
MSNEIRTVFTRVVVAVVAVIAVIVLWSSTYTVNQYEQAVVLQFGKPVGGPVPEPGLHFKTPFVQEVRFFDRRLLEWDGEPNEIPTKGREFIQVDAMARWRIVDPLKFLQSVKDVRGAVTRLDDILDSVVRDHISSTDLVEIVRSSTWDVTQVDLERGPRSSEEDQLTRRVEVGRERLEASILAEARQSMPQYGIELHDVRIKRLNYIPSVQQRVFERMISERQRIAEQFRSEGEGEASRIRGDTARQLAEVRSNAKREAEEVRGRGDAEAARIYNEAFGADPEFYGFFRTLQSYQETLGERTVLMLGADSEYLRFLGGSGGR